MVLRKTECVLCNCPREHLFKFPRESEKLKMWLRYLQLDSLLSRYGEEYLCNNGRLCGSHFAESAFTSTLCQKLIKTALPIDMRNEDTSSPSVSASILSASTVHRKMSVTAKSECDVTPKTRVIRRLRCQNSKLKRKLFKKIFLLDQFKDKLTVYQYDFVRSQINASKKDSRGRRWSAKDKALALELYHQSSATYTTLRKYFAFPCKNTLRKYVGDIAKDTGFCPLLYKAITKKVKSMSEREKLCTLVFDEMSLKSSVSYNPSLDIVDGFESAVRDDGESQLATQVLVFMLRGIIGNWKQVIAYYFRANSSPSGWFLRVVRDVIQKVQSSGLHVTALVCDQGPINQSLYRSLEVSVQKPYFYLNNQKIFCLYDMPHLIKSVRNNLKKYNCKYLQKKNGRNEICIAKWKDIEEFYIRDSAGSYRTAPALTKAHIYATGLSSMKVKLATQVFSHSVAAGICAYVYQNPDSGAHQTAHFVGTMDEIFNSLNSKIRHSAKPFGSAVCSDSNHIAQWKEWIDWIDSWKFQVSEKKFLKPACQRGLMLTMSAAIGIWEEIRNKVTYLLTNRLNQDCIENTFASVRRRGGFRDNPSAQEFRSTIRNVIVANFMKKSKSKNTEDDQDLNLIDFTQKDMALVILKDDDENEDNLIIDEEAEEVAPFSQKDRQVITYIAGVLANVFLKRLPCEKCSEILIGPKDLDHDNLLIFFKEYNTSVYGLKWPTDQFKNYVFLLSETFYRHVNSFIKKHNFRKNMLDILSNTAFNFFEDHDDHQNKFKEKIIIHFVNMMIKHEVRKLNSANLYYNTAKKMKHVKHE